MEEDDEDCIFSLDNFDPKEFNPYDSSQVAKLKAAFLKAGISPRKLLKRKMSNPQTNYSTETGQMKLQNHEPPKNILAALFRRQIGLYPSITFEDSAARQIIGSRAPFGRQPLSAVNAPFCGAGSEGACPKQWFRTKLSMGNVEAQVSYTKDLVIVKEPGVNTRTFYVPEYSLPKAPFKKLFVIKDNDKTPKKWRDYSVWSVPRMDSELKQVVRAPQTLFVLQSTKLVLYDLNNGRKIDELDLKFNDGPTHFSNLNIDIEAGKIYIWANSGACKQNQVKYELLLLSYPPVELLKRIIIPKISGLVEMDIDQNIFLIGKSSAVDLVDFEDLISLSTPLECSDTRHPNLKMSILNRVPEKVLLRLKTANQYLNVIPRTFPYHIVTKTKDAFEIHNIEKPFERLYSVKKSDASLGSEIEIKSFGEQKPRMLVDGLAHGFEIIEIHPEKKEVRVIFTTQDYDPYPSNSENSDISSNISNSSLRGGLRQNARISYTQYDLCRRTFAVNLDENVDLFAVCMVEDKILSVSLFRYSNLKLFKKLRPVKLGVPQGMSTVQCSNLEVHFDECFISVLVTLFDLKKEALVRELYSVNLAGEVMPA